MKQKLKGYEVIMGLIGAYCELQERSTVLLKDRSDLYKAVYSLCNKYPNIVGPFMFKWRGGECTSDDVDLCIRNLEDSKRLQCLNRDLVEFQGTDVMKEEYEKEVKPRLKRLSLFDDFQQIAPNI